MGEGDSAEGSHAVGESSHQCSLGAHGAGLCAGLCLVDVGQTVVYSISWLACLLADSVVLCVRRVMGSDVFHSFDADCPWSSLLSASHASRQQ